MSLSADIPVDVAQESCWSAGSRYEQRKLLGSGGFGSVYLCWDVVLERQVAVKMPLPSRLPTVARREQFLREARTAAAVRHPGMIAVHDCGIDEQGHCFVVYEYIDGQPLAALRQAWPMPPLEAARLVAGIAQAVHAAHKSGLVHRDLKPANILIGKDGQPRVADFGLAVDEASQRTRQGELAGTPAYMAPEQVRGEVHHLDGRADIWALGVILYELIAGRRPFQAADDDQLALEILEREARPPRQINDEIPCKLEQVCLRCLAKEIGARYTTALDLANDLQSVVAESASGLQPRTLAPAAAALVRTPADLFDQRPAATTQLPSASSSRYSTVMKVAAVAALLGLILATVVGRTLWEPKEPNHEAAAKGLDVSEPAAVLTEPLVWHDLVARRPRVLASVGPPPEIRWSKEDPKPWIAADYPALIELGTTREPNFELRIRVRQTPWNGRVAVYFGHGLHGGKPRKSRFQVLYLDHNHPAGPANSADLLLVRRLLEQELDGQRLIDERIDLAAEPIPHSQMEPLEIKAQIQSGALHSVFVGAQALPKLTILDSEATLPELSCEGSFGLFLENSTVIVERAEFRFQQP